MAALLWKPEMCLLRITGPLRMPCLVVVLHQRPGFVSFTVTWHGVNERVNIRNDDDGFAGEFIRNTAQMAWTATVGDFTFRSDPLTTSSSSFAEIGHERNGIFFP